MRIIVTGATGTAGSETLRQALADPDIAEVLVLARRQPNIANPKAMLSVAKHGSSRTILENDDIREISNRT